jgi:gamma-glutamyl hercynylcysteine S-oxide synthase
MTTTPKQRYRAMRRRTRLIFDLISPEAFDMRPISLRHPIRFYEGHLASFNFGMLLQSGFVKDDPQSELTQLFARGIDPLNQQAADQLTINAWPPRKVVADYVERVEQQMERAFEAEVDSIYLHTAIEHEEMHQETLMYLIHRLPHELKRKPDGVQNRTGKKADAPSWLQIDGGIARLGTDPTTTDFGWDNEFPQVSEKAGPFQISSRKVSNGDVLEFVATGGYENEKLWSEEAWRFVRQEGITAPQFWKRRGDDWEYYGLFESMPLPLEWPVYVSHIEAEAFAKWCGCRLPTEAEWHRAFDVVQVPDADRDNFDFVSWNPTPVSDSNAELSQLVGNGWEWTASEFGGFPGFKPFPHYPGYSADFFDGRHFVLKGASPVTPAPLVRPSFRNWFQDQYRHAYTAFRCARDA